MKEKIGMRVCEAEISSKYFPKLAAPNQTDRFVDFFGGYLGPRYLDHLIVCCIGTVMPAKRI
jgi:hypothetical protein